MREFFPGLKQAVSFLYALAFLMAGIAACCNASAAAEPKYAANLPPPAKLNYAIRASIKGLTVDGNGFIHWQKNNGKYVLFSETRSALTGTLLAEKSEGTQERRGLAPERFTSKRFRKSEVTTVFDHKTHQLIFSGNVAPQALHDGDLDRLSVIWQLLAIARAAPAQITPGTRFSFSVAGAHDLQPWIFEVRQKQTLRSALGETEAWQLIRVPEQEASSSLMEIWLAPAIDWFPIKLRISEDNGDYIEQSLESIEKK